MSSVDVEIFEDEELLQEVSVHSLGGITEAANWTSPRNLALSLVSGGLWHIFLVTRAVLSGDISSTRYVITDERIIEASGVVSRSTTQYEFEQLVGDIETEQGFIQRLLDVGDVTFEVQKTRALSQSTGKIGDRDRRETNRDVRRQQIRLEDVQDHTDVANTIRRIHRD